MKLISDFVIITKADEHYLNITRKCNNSYEQKVRQGVTDDLDQPTRLTYFIPTCLAGTLVTLFFKDKELPNKATSQVLTRKLTFKC